jgi:oligopeptide transport system substrate-binding protein
MNRTVLGLFGLIAAMVLAIGVLGILILGGGDDDGGTVSGDATRPPSGSRAGPQDLRLLGVDPVTLDPALATDVSSARYILEIFGGLVTIDKQLNIVGDIAERWDISDDGLTYTFFLRRDAFFHDGRRVTAEDFKYSMERAANQRTGSPVAEAFLGDIVGARDMARGRANSISGIEVVNDTTLRISIDAPKPYFLAKLSYPTAFVVDRQQVESNPRNWTRRPNGTGPFKLQEWRLNERIILVANERYHLGAPQIQRVLFNLAGGSGLTQYENGDVDVAGIGITDIERVKSPRDPLNQEYKTGPNLSIGYVGFNTRAQPFDDPKVRQAFAMAINRQQLIEIVGRGMDRVANSFMMEGLPGFNPQARLPEFNPAEARRLLEESTYGGARGLPRITFTEVGGGGSAGLGTQAIIEMWREHLGVDVSIAQTEWAAFLDDLDRGRLQLYSLGWVMDYPDPENIIDLLFHSTSRQNNSGYSNPEFDALVEAARTERDVEKRLQLYRDAEQMLIRDLPWMPLNFSNDHFVVKPYVKGYESMPMTIPILRYVSIER